MRTVRFAAVLILLSTVACGARWTDEQRAEVASRGSAAGSDDGSTGSGGPAAAGAGGSSPGAGGQTGSTVAGGGPVVTAGPGGGPAASGDGGEPAGDGGTASAALPCAVHSDAPGVTDTQVDVGSISSLSGPVPGLATSAAAAVRSYVAYRNSIGGVCGRQIVLHEADDGTDNSRYRSVVTELEPTVFGIAGGFPIGDPGGIDVVRDTGIPVVDSPSAQAVADLPNVFDVVPAYDDPHELTGKYRFLYESGAHTVAIAYLAVDQSRFEANLQRGLMEAAGMQVVLQQELPLSTLSYDATARAVANSHADYLFFIADINGESAMAHSMADTGYPLKFSEYYNFAYGTPFLDLAGSSAEGTLAWLRTLPTEEAGTNAELGAFVDWMGRIAPEADIDQIAGDGWAAAKAFFDTMEALPGPITRESFVQQLAATQTYDAGGMYGTIRLGAERTNACFVGVQVRGGQWRRLAPAGGGFLCN